MRRLRFPHLVVAALAGVGGCQSLPDIEPGLCGNQVLDAGEDCDTNVEAGRACGTSDAAACRFVWAGTAECPPGFAWGLDGICRNPTLEWEDIASISLPGGGSHALVADVDGDLLSDLVVGSPANGAYRAYFLGLGGNLRTSLDIPLQASIGFSPAPALGPLTGPRSEQTLRPGYTTGADTTADVVVPTVGGVFVLRGGDGPELTPKSYAPFELPESRIFSFPLAALDVDQGDQDLPGIATDTPEGLSLRFAQGEAFTEVALIPGGAVKKVIGRIERIEWSDDDAHPGDEILVSLETQDKGTRLVVASVATGELLLDYDDEDAPLQGQGFPVRFGDLPTEQIVVGAAVLRPLGTADGVPLCDPLPQPYPGIVGLARFEDSAFRFFETLRGDVSVPIRVADGDADGAPEIATDRYVASLDCDFDGEGGGGGGGEGGAGGGAGGGTAGGGGAGPDCVVETAEPVPLPPECALFPLATNGGLTGWRDVRLADLNGDGAVDLASATDAPGIDLLMGLENPARLTTPRPVSALDLGDFDGDGSLDLLAVSKRGFEVDCEVEDDILIAYGRAAALPEAPVVVGAVPAIIDVAVGKLLRLLQIDGVDDFGVLSACGQELPRSAAIFFGATSRQVASPFNIGITTAGADGIVEADFAAAMAVGSFLPGVADHEHVAAAGLQTNGEDEAQGWVWVARGTGDADLAGSSTVSLLDLPEVDPTSWFLTLFGARSIAADLTRTDVGLDTYRLRGGTQQLVTLIPTINGASELTPRLLVASFADDLTVADYRLFDGLPVPTTLGDASSFTDIYFTGISLEAGDLDGDGDLDVAVLFRANVGNTAQIFWNDGGVLTAELIDLQGKDDGEGPTGLALLDAEPGKTLPVLLVSTRSRVFSIASRGGVPRGIVKPRASGTGQIVGVATGDFDGDGLVDVAVLRPEGVDIHRQAEIATGKVEDAVEPASDG